jgi:hypothetical protein
LYVPWKQRQVKSSADKLAEARINEMKAQTTGK